MIDGFPSLTPEGFSETVDRTCSAVNFDSNLASTLQKISGIN